MFGSIREVSDQSPYDWIRNGVRPWEQRGNDIALRTLDEIPPTFPAYAKVFHPVFEDPDHPEPERTWDEEDRADRPTEPHPVLERMQNEGTYVRSGIGDLPPTGLRRVRWSELAGQLGLPYGPELYAGDLDRAWPGRSWPARYLGPDEGDLIPSMLHVLCDLVEDEGRPAPCYFWWEMIAGTSALGSFDDHLFLGPLRKLPGFVAQKHCLSPTYWWPEHRAWCVHTDYDSCFTIVGGSEALVERILEHAEVEGFRVQPNDALVLYPHRRAE